MSVKSKMMRQDLPLPNELQHLQNIINDAKNEPNHSAALLRNVIKEAADRAPERDIIRLAETVLQCGIDIDRAQWAESN